MFAGLIAIPAAGPALTDRAAVTVVAVPERLAPVPEPLMTMIAVGGHFDAPEFETADADEFPQTPASGCALDETVRQALANSPEAQAALAQIPLQARSVANALLIWDGGWTLPVIQADPGTLDVVRAVVIRSLRDVDARCRAAVVIGPRLVVVPGGGSAVVLAFGSGRWRWDDVSA